MYGFTTANVLFFTTTAKGLPDYVVHRSLSMVDGMNEIRVKTFIKHTS